MQEQLISRVYRGRSGPLWIDPITIPETGAGVEKRERARLDSAAEARRLHRRRAFPWSGVSVAIQLRESVPTGEHSVRGNAFIYNRAAFILLEALGATRGLEAQIYFV